MWTRNKLSNLVETSRNDSAFYNNPFLPCDCLRNDNKKNEKHLSHSKSTRHDGKIILISR